MAETVGLASLHKALAVRYGSSRRAMMSDVVLGWLEMRRRRGRDVLVNFSLGACRAGMAALQGSRPARALSSLPHAPAPAPAVVVAVVVAVTRSRSCLACCFAADLTRTQGVSLLLFSARRGVVIPSPVLAVTLWLCVWVSSSPSCVPSAYLGSALTVAAACAFLQVTPRTDPGTPNNL